MSGDCRELRNALHRFVQFSPPAMLSISLYGRWNSHVAQPYISQSSSRDHFIIINAGCFFLYKHGVSLATLREDDIGSKVVLQSVGWKAFNHRNLTGSMLAVMNRTLHQNNLLSVARSHAEWIKPSKSSLHRLL